MKKIQNLLLIVVLIMIAAQPLMAKQKQVKLKLSANVITNSSCVASDKEEDCISKEEFLTIEEMSKSFVRNVRETFAKPNVELLTVRIAKEEKLDAFLVNLKTTVNKQRVGELVSYEFEIYGTSATNKKNDKMLYIQSFEIESENIDVKEMTLKVIQGLRQLLNDKKPFMVNGLTPNLEDEVD